MSYLFTIEAIISAFIYYNFKAIRKKSGDYFGLVLLNFILIICFFLFSQEIGFWGAIPMLLISMVGSLANPWLVIIINKYTLSEFRATTLSTVAMILKIPYVLTIGYIGNLIDDGFLRGTLLSIAIILLIIAVIEIATTVGLKNKHKKLMSDQ